MDKIKNNFENNRIKFNYFETKEEAKVFLEENIKLEENVDFGGSVSLRELEIYESLKSRNQDVFWHWKDEKKNHNKRTTYLTSSNAITEDGKLVNMDGVGNRISAMFFGYENVYIVVGKNKLVRDVEEGRARIREIAGPKNAQRLNVKTPCVVTGKCSDCNSAERICSVETIIHKAPGKVNMNIVFINENLGF